MERQNSRGSRRPGSSSSSGSMLNHVQIRRNSASQPAGPRICPANPSEQAPCFSHPDFAPGTPVFIHQQTRVVSSVIDTFIIAAGPDGPYSYFSPPSAPIPNPFTPPADFYDENFEPDPPVPFEEDPYVQPLEPVYEPPQDPGDGHLGDDNEPLTVAEKTARNAWIVQLIEEFFLRLVQQLAAEQVPTIEYDLRGEDWADFELQDDNRLRLKPEGVHRKTISLARGQTTVRFVSIAKLMGRIKALLLTDSYATKRELFYENVNLYGAQGTVNNAINTITLILQVPRCCLNITAVSKGLVAGHLTFLNEVGVEVDCMQTVTGIAVPTLVRHTEVVRSTAKFILVVEKEASFQQLLEEDICSIPNNPCIMITAKGYPDEATRYFLLKLLKVLDIPVFAITDADPHGVDIMCMYRYGTKAPHFENISLALPSMLWMGVFPTDVAEIIDFPDEVLLQLTDRDRELANDIIDRPYCLPALRHQMEVMLQLDRKLEIQNVNAIGPRYFVDVYLRDKLQQQEWI